MSRNYLDTQAGFKLWLVLATAVILFNIALWLFLVWLVVNLLQYMGVL